MAEVSIVITDEGDGDVRIKTVETPLIQEGEPHTTAQVVAIRLLQHAARMADAAVDCPDEAETPED